MSRAEESALVLRGRCLPHGRGITFRPLVEIVRAAAGIREDDDASAARASFGPSSAKAETRCSSECRSPWPWTIMPSRSRSSSGARDSCSNRSATAARSSSSSTTCTGPSRRSRSRRASPDSDPRSLRPHPLPRPRRLPRSSSRLGCPRRPPSQARAAGRGGHRGDRKAILGDGVVDARIRPASSRPQKETRCSPSSSPPWCSTKGASEHGAADVEALLRIVASSDDPRTPRSQAGPLGERRAADARGSVGGWARIPRGRGSPPRARADHGRRRDADRITRAAEVRPCRPAAEGDGHSFRFSHMLVKDAVYQGILKRARAALHERFVEWADTVNRDRSGPASSRRSSPTTWSRPSGTSGSSARSTSTGSSSAGGQPVCLQPPVGARSPAATWRRPRTSCAGPSTCC